MSSTQQHQIDWFRLITHTSSGSLNKIVKRNLFYTLFTKYKSRSSKGVNSEKHRPTEQYVQDMTKILHDAENCNFGAHGFNIHTLAGT